MGRPPRFRNEIEVAVAQRPWPETCIIFIGRRQPNGYGRVSENGTSWDADSRLLCDGVPFWPEDTRG